MGFQVKKATREKIFVKLALMSPSGGGKTYGSLRIATGMANEIKKQTNKKAKILMANTEVKRGYYYANEFDYDIVDIEAPHNPEKYVELIDFAVKEGYDILIIDSTSHEWEGKGGCLELHQQAGGSYQAWGKVTPRHNRFINAIADSPIHILSTMRGKDMYEIDKDDKGKINVKKLGVGAKQREGFEYEFTATFLIDQKTNMAEAQKDNTHIFENEGAVILSESHGERLIQWANSGDAEYIPMQRNKAEDLPEESLAEIKEEINKIATEKASIDRDAVVNLIKQHHKSGNPNGIKDITIAKTVLEEIKKLEVK